MNNNNNNKGDRSQSRGRSRTPKPVTSFRSPSRSASIIRATNDYKNRSSVARQAQNRLDSIPVASQRVRGISEPKFSRSAGNGDITVDHEEFISDIVGSQGFLNRGFDINPGLSATFPWLNQMAPLYESYRFEKLEFCYQSSSSSSQTGAVMMAVDYDASDALAPNKQSLAPYRGYVRSAPWKEANNFSLKEDLSKRSSYYVRTGSVPTNSDVKLYDVGRLNMATQGQINDTDTIGELYVRYRVKLMTPQLQLNGLGTSTSMKVIASSLTGALTTTGNAPIVPSGNADLLTLTSVGPYQGLVVVRATGGATLTGIGTGGTASFTVVGSSMVNAGQTDATLCVAPNWTAVGQTLTLDLTGTSLTGYSVRLGNYQTSLA